MITCNYITGNTLNFYDFQLQYPPASANFLFRAKLKDYPFEKSFYCLNSSGVDDYLQFILSISGGTEVLSGSTNGVNVHLSAGTYNLSVYSDSGSTFNWSAATFLGYDEMYVDKSLVSNPTPPVPIVFPSVCLPVTVTDHLSAVTVASGGAYSCAPFSSVTVYDSLAATTANTLTEGTSYTCTTAPAVTSTKEFSFATTATTQYDKIRFDFNATVNLDAATLVNIASVVYKKNGVVVTGTQSFVIGDDLYMLITRTNAALAASLSLVFNYVTDSSTIAVPNYFWASWKQLEKIVSATTVFEQTKNALLTTGSGAAITFNKGAYSNESFVGASSIEIDWTAPFSVWGMSTQNTTSPHDISRMKYAIYNNSGDLFVMENGSVVFGFGSPGGRYFVAQTKIVDTGAAIQYWVKYNYAAYALVYTSLQAYVVGETHYANIVCGVEGTTLNGIKIYK